jgi:hypothetical protein
MIPFIILTIRIPYSTLISLILIKHFFHFLIILLFFLTFLILISDTFHVILTNSFDFKNVFLLFIVNVFNEFSLIYLGYLIKVFLWLMNFYFISLLIHHHVIFLSYLVIPFIIQHEIIIISRILKLIFVLMHQPSPSIFFFLPIHDLPIIIFHSFPSIFIIHDYLISLATDIHGSSITTQFIVDSIVFLIYILIISISMSLHYNSAIFISHYLFVRFFLNDFIILYYFLIQIMI